jgi:phosphate transport system substrate-binding protein
VRSTRWLRWPIAFAASIALFAAACGGDSGSGTTTTAGGSTTTSGSQFDYGSLETATLNGSGSSFQDAFNQEAKTEFASVAPTVTVNYAKSGSSAGKQDLANQTVQFAGTDSTIKPEDLPTYKGGDVLYFPTVGAPITVSYNLPSVDTLKLSPDTIAKIFQAQITTWDDPAIAADNPDATLPSTAITVVHRSDGSGTTSNFTKFLTKAAPSTWTLGTSDTVQWPTSTQGAEKNSGVAQAVTATEGAIGYVDLADAVNANLQTAEVKNADGSFVGPTLDAASAALAGAAVNDDLTYDPINAPGADAYPITSPTWIILYKDQADAAIGNALKGWLTFILTEGQGFANSVGYAPLPSELAQKALTQVDDIVVG